MLNKNDVFVETETFETRCGRRRILTTLTSFASQCSVVPIVQKEKGKNLASRRRVERGADNLQAGKKEKGRKKGEH